MARGFVKSNNLSESSTGPSDRGILNNLGGLNIADDILLFDGNTKFTQKLVADDYEVVDDIVIVTGEGKVTFSDGTLISHDGSAYQYIVKNSNGVDRFQLYDTLDAVFVPTGVLKRNDTVTSVNLGNLSRKAIITNIERVSGLASTEDLYNSQSINSQTSYIDGNIASFYYKRERIPRVYEASVFNSPVAFSGPVRVTNDANASQGVDTPGLFIVDVSDPDSTGIRAFGDASNPWSADVGELKTTEDNSKVSTLKLEPSSNSVPNFDSTLNDHYIVEEISAGDYTHKLPVTVNGQQYYLLLKGP